MPSAITSQINARIDSQLKREGDEALAQAGLTPTQAVRALWKLAVTYASDPGRLVAVLDPEQADQTNDARAEHRRQVEKALDAGETLMRRAYAEAGLDWPAEPDMRTYDQLREDAYRETYASEMGWNA